MPKHEVLDEVGVFIKHLQGLDFFHDHLQSLPDLNQCFL
jgi:hypothetical protein